MKLSPLKLGCSIQIEDSLADGISHFYAEILRLKKLVDLAQQDKNVLFFFDEILLQFHKLIQRHRLLLIRYLH